MCKAPKTPKAPPTVLDTTPEVEEQQALRRRRRGYAGTYTQGFRGDMQRAPVAIKELTGA